MRLAEIFDKQFDIKWEKENIEDTKAFLDISNIPIEIFFEKISDIEIYISFKTDQLTRITNKNKDQFLIFSAVYQAIKEYLDNHREIELVTFTSFDKKRSILYKMFIDKYASKLGFKLDNLHSNTGEYHHSTRYTLKRI